MTCTPEELADLAKCFLGVSWDERDAMHTYLVTQLAP